jgi:hypothetical protein
MGGTCLASALAGGPLNRNPWLDTGHSKGGADEVVDTVSNDSSRLSSSPSLRIPANVDNDVGVVMVGLSPPSDRDTE